MEFYDVLQKRRSIRSFSNKPVETSKIKNILNAAMRAPSAGNLQAYKIYLVHSQDKREAFLAAANYKEFMSQAPLVIVFVADLQLSESKFGSRGLELYSIQDATIATTYAQLAITAEGLASVWVGAFDPLEVSRILNLDSYHVPVSILAAGYPGEKAEPKPFSRKPITEVIKEA
jgi:nitroreductase